MSINDFYCNIANNWIQSINQSRVICHQNIFHLLNALKEKKSNEWPPRYTNNNCYRSIAHIHDILVDNRIFFFTEQIAIFGANTKNYFQRSNAKAFLSKAPESVFSYKVINNYYLKIISITGRCRLSLCSKAIYFRCFEKQSVVVCFSCASFYIFLYIFNSLLLNSWAWNTGNVSALSQKNRLWRWI